MTTNHWTDVDVKRLHELLATMSIGEAAERLGRTRESVTSKIARLRMVGTVYVAGEKLEGRDVPCPYSPSIDEIYRHAAELRELRPYDGTSECAAQQRRIARSGTRWGTAKRRTASEWCNRVSADERRVAPP